MRHHAHHLVLMKIPIPRPELASEKAWRSRKVGGGMMGRDTLTVFRHWSHQERSL